jgi:imidazoleglycerol-phosphate dehydratase
MADQQRKAEVSRKTKETDIQITLVIDGSGETNISTGIGFFDHMLDALGRHSQMDLTVKVTGDLHIDGHHTVEDTGIVLGQALSQALGDKMGIMRFASAYVPLDEALSRAVVDFSGRGSLVFRPPLTGMTGELDASLVREFFAAVADNAKCTLHLESLYGDNLHHKVESMFKAVAVALRDAMASNTRMKGLPTTKGAL